MKVKIKGITAQDIVTANTMWMNGSSGKEIAAKIGIPIGSIGELKKKIAQYLDGTKKVSAATSDTWREAVTLMQEPAPEREIITEEIVVKTIPTLETPVSQWVPDADASGIVVYRTKNYAQFKKVIGNRPINLHNVNYMTSAMAKINLLPHFPAFVSADGYLLDGQHRLESVTVNKEWFYFTVSSQTLSDHVVADVNSAHHNWTIPNYVNYFAKKGNKQYEFLWELSEEYKVSPTLLLELITSIGTSGKSGVKKGNMKIFETEEDKEIIRAFIDGYIFLQPSLSNEIWRHSKFVRALRRMFALVTPQEIQTEIVTNPKPFQYQRTAADYLRQFEEYFNYMKSEKNYVRFF